MSIGERKPTTFVLESVEWRCDLPNAMLVNTLAGVITSYVILELKERLWNTDTQIAPNAKPFVI